MTEDKTVTVDDFTEITAHMEKALDGINTLYTSSFLNEQEKSRLGQLGRALHTTAHGLEHLFMELKSGPERLRQALQRHYRH